MKAERISAPGFEGYVRSEIGGRSENQDSYGWKEVPLGLVVTVCDGMGGGPAGKTASSIAVKAILDYMAACNDPETAEEDVQKAIIMANKAVYQKACSQPELQGMGSTCTVLLLTPDMAYTAYVGDSRIYQLRGHRKLFRTFDHSMVFELVKQKVITEEQARQSAQSNVITRALGLQPAVEIDMQSLNFREGDRFLMSTDGIHGVIPEKELLEDVCNRHESVEDIVENLADKIDGIGREKGGGHDNMTLVVVDCETSSSAHRGIGSLFCSFFRRLFVFLASLVTLLAASMQQSAAQSAVWKVRPAYQRMEICYGNLWKCMDADGKWELMNIDNQSVFTAKYDSITYFKNDYALGLNAENGKWRIAAVINKSNNLVMHLKKACYATSEPYFSEGMVGVANIQGLQGFMKADGSMAVKFRYFKVNPFKDGKACVIQKNHTEAYIDAKGKKLKTAARDESKLLSEACRPDMTVADQGYTVYSANAAYGYKFNNKVVVPAQFEHATPFFYHSAGVCKGGKWGLITLTADTIRGKVTVEGGTAMYEVRFSERVRPELIEVVAVQEDGSRKILVTPDIKGNTAAYTISPKEKRMDIELYYDGILHEKTAYKGVTTVTDEVRTGGLVISSFYKKNKRADKQDNEYIVATVRNTSSTKQSVTVTIYVDGKPYSSKLTVKPKKTATATATVKVKKERIAKVYVKLSNGQQTTPKEINLKPFY